MHSKKECHTVHLEEVWWKFRIQNVSGSKGPISEAFLLTGSFP